jgi:hypothetical protein
MTKKCIIPLLVAIAASTAVFAADWNYNGTGDWSDSANWTGGTPGTWTAATINNGGTAVIDADQSIYELFVGTTSSGNVTSNDRILSIVSSLSVAQQTGSTGFLQLNGGSISTGNNNNFVIGRGGNGTLELNSADASFDWGYIGGEIYRSALQANGTGTVILNGSSTFTTTSGITLGTGPTSSGTLTVNDSSQVISAAANALWIGYEGEGTLNVNGGLVSAGNATFVGTQAGSKGVINLSNGELSLSKTLYVGYNGAGEMTMDGGTASLSAALYIGTNSGSTGVVDINGGTMTVSSVYVGVFAGGTGRMNLNGGLLVTNQLSGWEGTGTLTFNGGTIKALADNSNFINNFGTISVGEKGAIIDTNGKNVAVNGSLNGAVGGLTKKNDGSLTLTKSSTLGSLTHEAGNLILSTGQIFTVSGNSSLNSGSTLHFADASQLTSDTLTLYSASCIELNPNLAQLHVGTLDLDNLTGGKVDISVLDFQEFEIGQSLEIFSFDAVADDYGSDLDANNYFTFKNSPDSKYVFSWGENALFLTIIPEPSTYGIMATIGSIGVFLSIRRRRKSL